MNAQQLAAFWTVSILFVITPGVDWAYAIAAGLKGRRHVAPAVAGLLLGHLLAVLLVAAGIGVLLARYPLAQLALTCLGALYLFWIGIMTLRHPSVPKADDGATAQHSGHWLLNGIAVSGLNPKVFLLYLALLPKFVDSALAWPAALQMVVLGMLSIGSAVVVYMLVGVGAQSLLSARPQAARRVSQCSGIAMMAIGTLLLIDLFL